MAEWNPFCSPYSQLRGWRTRRIELSGHDCRHHQRSGATGPRARRLIRNVLRFTHRSPSMPKQLGIIDLLALFGFDASLKSKLVRHQDTRYDVPTLIREGWFDLYQSIQARPVFKACKQIVSFIGDGSSRARFFGVYRVTSQQPLDKRLIPDNCPYHEWRESAKHQYTLERCSEFAELEGRVVIDWGSGALAWHQHLKNKRVIEIAPPGRSLDAFTDYLDFTLGYVELKELVANPKAHRDWVASLSAVAGVYLILAQTTGHQYVGSAFGADGFWGRWSQYAINGHGGNVRLKELLVSDASYPDAFRYSVLQVLPKTTTAREVIRWESQYKIKLGSRATGLNLN